jgi:hypothetical protein
VVSRQDARSSSCHVRPSRTLATRAAAARSARHVVRQRISLCVAGDGFTPVQAGQVRTTVSPLAGCSWATGPSGVAAADVLGPRLGPNVFGQQGAKGVEDQQPVASPPSRQAISPASVRLTWNLVPRAYGALGLNPSLPRTLLFPDRRRNLSRRTWRFDHTVAAHAIPLHVPTRPSNDAPRRAGLPHDLMRLRPYRSTTCL